MKIKLVISSLIIFILFQKDKIIGKYRDNFGSEITINENGTYDYSANVHTLGFFSGGKWKVKNDTIFLISIPIYDTIRIPKKRDSLRLSGTKIAHLITAPSYKDIIWPKGNYGGQVLFKNKRLFFRDDKLYEIDNDGKLIIEKQIRSNEKVDPWYSKTLN